MDTLPSSESIANIASAHFLQQQISHRAAEILWEKNGKEWSYELIGKWMQTTTFLLTLGEQKFALKLSNNEKFLQDTHKEIWVSESLKQKNPKIFSHGESQLPGMAGRYFWNIQEYIPWPLWEDGEMNARQLDSYLSQLNSLHAIEHPWIPRWWLVMDDTNGSEENFEKYIDIFRKKIDKCDFFSQENRRERVLTQIDQLLTKIRDMSEYKTVLIHNDAHAHNVILDSPESVRIIDYWNMKWSCPEEEFAVIQTHFFRSRMNLFTKIMERYSQTHAVNSSLFEFFVLLSACSKIKTRKVETKRLLLWNELIEPLLHSI